MKYYEIYNWDGVWEIWEWNNNGGKRFKVFKTKKGVKNWASKQWVWVIWR